MAEVKKEAVKTAPEKSAAVKPVAKTAAKPVAAKAEVKAAVKPAAKTEVKVAEVAKVAKTEVKPAAKKVVKPAVKKATGKQIKVTLVKSTNKAQEFQKRTVEALGLNKIRSFKIHNDNPAIRGMIYRVNHLVKVEEVKGE